MFQNSEQHPLHKYTYQIPGQEKVYPITSDQINYQQQQQNKDYIDNTYINGTSSSGGGGG